ncbi:MAG: hypothetical protein ACTSRZ_06640 [Promethearchaeota archaeon]
MKPLTKKQIIILLSIFSGVIIIFVVMGALGLPFPSGNPDGFEKAVFDDAGISESENFLGIDFGEITDFILGPAGIFIAFGLTLVVFYLIMRKPKNLIQKNQATTK